MQHGCFTYTGLLEGKYDSMYTSTTEDKETAETSNSVSIRKEIDKLYTSSNAARQVKRKTQLKWMTSVWTNAVWF